MPDLALDLPSGSRSAVIVIPSPARLLGDVGRNALVCGSKPVDIQRDLYFGRHHLKTDSGVTALRRFFVAGVDPRTDYLAGVRPYEGFHHFPARSVCAPKSGAATRPGI